MWIYSQTSGTIWCPAGREVAIGYSGFGQAKNKPDMETEANLGPIPRGMYEMGKPCHSTRVGPDAIPLTPCQHKAHGRTNLFIHGDSKSAPGTISKGCLVANKYVRTRMIVEQYKLLLVIE